MYTLEQNVIELSAAVHELPTFTLLTNFVPYVAVVKKPKIRSYDLDL